jgi:hypothetical protein
MSGGLGIAYPFIKIVVFSVLEFIASLPVLAIHQNNGNSLVNL